MAFIFKTILHVDGVTRVKVKGLMKNGVFEGEYKFQGMFYGVSMTEEQILNQFK